MMKKLICQQIRELCCLSTREVADILRVPVEAIESIELSGTPNYYGWWLYNNFCQNPTALLSPEQISKIPEENKILLGIDIEKE